MEEAIFISKLSGLKHLSSGKYARLYFGNEFCERLLPSINEIKDAFYGAQRRGLNFTFVTPYVTNWGIERIRPLLEFLIKEYPNLEIVINDWGLYRFIKRKFGRQNFLLGRLLTKQKRGPRILRLAGKVPETMLAHFRTAAADNSVWAEFLMKAGISRIELDNLLQGIRREASLPASLYIPFAYITTTRYCCFASWKSADFDLRDIRPCQKECSNYVFSLSNRNMPVEILLKGNTQFFENRALPPNLEDLNITRLVYEPDIPM